MAGRSAVASWPAAAGFALGSSARAVLEWLAAGAPPGFSRGGSGLWITPPSLPRLPNMSLLPALSLELQAFQETFEATLLALPAFRTPREDMRHFIDRLDDGVLRIHLAQH